MNNPENHNKLCCMQYLALLCHVLPRTSWEVVSSECQLSRPVESPCIDTQAAEFGNNKPQKMVPRHLHPIVSHRLGKGGSAISDSAQLISCVCSCFATF
jgi:hypothetical protein